MPRRAVLDTPGRLAALYETSLASSEGGCGYVLRSQPPTVAGLRLWPGAHRRIRRAAHHQGAPLAIPRSLSVATAQPLVPLQRRGGADRLGDGCGASADRSVGCRDLCTMAGAGGRGA